jgi:hypothetical protein
MFRKLEITEHMRILSNILGGARMFIKHGQRHARNTEFRDFEAESEVFKRVPDLQEMSVDEINH